MLDDSQRLRDTPHLLALLLNYATQGIEDRITWRDRVMQMEGVEPQEISALHGELIAFDWIEQNTGHTRLLPDGRLSACYRITLNGLREFRKFHGVEIAEDRSQPLEKSQLRFPQKKKQKGSSLDASAVATLEE